MKTEHYTFALAVLQIILATFLPIQIVDRQVVEDAIQLIAAMQSVMAQVEKRRLDQKTRD